MKSSPMNTVKSFCVDGVGVPVCVVDRTQTHLCCKQHSDSFLGPVNVQLHLLSIFCLLLKMFTHSYFVRTFLSCFVAVFEVECVHNGVVLGINTFLWYWMMVATRYCKQ